MRVLNLFLTSGTIGLIGLIIHQIADDYWMYHPSHRARVIAYAVRQTCKLIACLFFPYMIVLGIICAFLFLGD